MDPTSIVEDTEWKRFCPQTDGQTDRRTLWNQYTLLQRNKFTESPCVFILSESLPKWSNRPISHNALDTYPTMHHFVTEMCTCTFLLQNGTLWDTGLVHCGIFATGLLTGLHLFKRRHTSFRTYYSLLITITSTLIQITDSHRNRRQIISCTYHDPVYRHIHVLPVLNKFTSTLPSKSKLPNVLKARVMLVTSDNSDSPLLESTYRKQNMKLSDRKINITCTVEPLRKGQESLTKVAKFGPFRRTILYKSCLFYPSWQATSFERPSYWVAFLEGSHCISIHWFCARMGYLQSRSNELTAFFHKAIELWNEGVDK